MRTAKENKNKKKHDGLTVGWMTDYFKNYKDEVAAAEFDEVKKFYKSILSALCGQKRLILLTFLLTQNHKNCKKLAKHRILLRNAVF